jgi:ClpX C4-type zinc finger
VADKRKPKPPAKKPRASDLLAAFEAPPCSFCGRTPLEHEGLQFQKGDYRICADCVSRMHRELKGEVEP